jgi:hypothetical protein
MIIQKEEVQKEKDQLHEQLTHISSKLHKLAKTVVDRLKILDPESASSPTLKGWVLESCSSL